MKKHSSFRTKYIYLLRVATFTKSWPERISDLKQDAIFKLNPAAKAGDMYELSASLEKSPEITASLPIKSYNEISAQVINLKNMLYDKYVATQRKPTTSIKSYVNLKNSRSKNNEI